MFERSTNAVVAGDRILCAAQMYSFLPVDSNWRSYSLQSQYNYSHEGKRLKRAEKENNGGGVVSGRRVEVRCDGWFWDGLIRLK